MYKNQSKSDDGNVRTRPVAAATKPTANSSTNGIGNSTSYSHDVTRIYLGEIGRARLLTADEEKSLSRAMSWALANA